jgi:transcriptional regulator with XRE-family HTH domain
LTQDALAEAAGVSPATIVRLEQPGALAELRTIATLAQALGVPPAELMRPDDRPR